MSVVLDYVKTLDVSHVSLHYDGIRVGFNSNQPDIIAICAECQKRVLERTGFQINIRRKLHYTFVDCVRSLTPHSDSPLQIDDVLRVEGNCIPTALLHLTGNGAITTTLMNDTLPENVLAKKDKHRSYESCEKLFTVQFYPFKGLQLSKDC